MSFYLPEIDQRSALVRDYCTDALSVIDPDGIFLPRFVQEVQTTSDREMSIQERDVWLREIAQRTGMGSVAPFIVELLVIAAQDVAQRNEMQKNITGI